MTNEANNNQLPPPTEETTVPTQPAPEPAPEQPGMVDPELIQNIQESQKSDYASERSNAIVPTTQGMSEYIIGKHDEGASLTNVTAAIQKGEGNSYIDNFETFWPQVGKGLVGGVAKGLVNIIKMAPGVLAPFSSTAESMVDDLDKFNTETFDEYGTFGSKYHGKSMEWSNPNFWADMIKSTATSVVEFGATGYGASIAGYKLAKALQGLSKISGAGESTLAFVNNTFGKLANSNIAAERAGKVMGAVMSAYAESSVMALDMKRNLIQDAIANGKSVEEAIHNYEKNRLGFIGTNMLFSSILNYVAIDSLIGNKFGNTAQGAKQSLKSKAINFGAGATSEYFEETIGDGLQHAFENYSTKNTGVGSLISDTLGYIASEEGIQSGVGGLLGHGVNTLTSKLVKTMNGPVMPTFSLGNQARPEYNEVVEKPEEFKTVEHEHNINRVMQDGSEIEQRIKGKEYVPKQYEHEDFVPEALMSKEEHKKVNGHHYTTDAEHDIAYEKYSKTNAEKNEIGLSEYKAKLKAEGKLTREEHDHIQNFEKEVHDTALETDVEYQKDKEALNKEVREQVSKISKEEGEELLNAGKLTKQEAKDKINELANQSLIEQGFGEDNMPTQEDINKAKKEAKAKVDAEIFYVDAHERLLSERGLTRKDYLASKAENEDKVSKYEAHLAKIKDNEAAQKIWDEAFVKYETELHKYEVATQNMSTNELERLVQVDIVQAVNTTNALRSNDPILKETVVADTILKIAGKAYIYGGLDVAISKLEAIIDDKSTDDSGKPLIEDEAVREQIKKLISDIKVGGSVYETFKKNSAKTNSNVAYSYMLANEKANLLKKYADESDVDYQKLLNQQIELLGDPSLLTEARKVELQKKIEAFQEAVQALNTSNIDNVDAIIETFKLAEDNLRDEVIALSHLTEDLHLGTNSVERLSRDKLEQFKKAHSNIVEAAGKKGKSIAKAIIARQAAENILDEKHIQKKVIAAVKYLEIKVKATKSKQGLQLVNAELQSLKALLRDKTYRNLMDRIQEKNKELDEIDRLKEIEKIQLNTYEARVIDSLDDLEHQLKFLKGMNDTDAIAFLEGLSVETVNHARELYNKYVENKADVDDYSEQIKQKINNIIDMYVNVQLFNRYASSNNINKMAASIELLQNSIRIQEESLLKLKEQIRESQFNLKTDLRNEVDYFSGLQKLDLMNTLLGHFEEVLKNGSSEFFNNTNIITATPQELIDSVNAEIEVDADIEENSGPGLDPNGDGDGSGKVETEVVSTGPFVNVGEIIVKANEFLKSPTRTKTRLLEDISKAIAQEKIRNNEKLVKELQELKVKVKNTKTNAKKEEVNSTSVLTTINEGQTQGDPTNDIGGVSSVSEDLEEGPLVEKEIVNDISDDTEEVSDNEPEIVLPKIIIQPVKTEELPDETDEDNDNRKQEQVFFINTQSGPHELMLDLGHTINNSVSSPNDDENKYAISAELSRMLENNETLTVVFDPYMFQASWEKLPTANNALSPLAIAFNAILNTNAQGYDREARILKFLTTLYSSIDGQPGTHVLPCYVNVVVDGTAHKVPFNVKNVNTTFHNVQLLLALLEQNPNAKSAYIGTTIKPDTLSQLSMKVNISAIVGNRYKSDGKLHTAKDLFSENARLEYQIGSYNGKTSVEVLHNDKQYVAFRNKISGEMVQALFASVASVMSFKYDESNPTYTIKQTAEDLTGFDVAFEDLSFQQVSSLVSNRDPFVSFGPHKNPTVKQRVPYLTVDGKTIELKKSEIIQLAKGQSVSPEIDRMIDSIKNKYLKFQHTTAYLKSLGQFTYRNGKTSKVSNASDFLIHNGLTFPFSELTPHVNKVTLKINTNYMDARRLAYRVSSGLDVENAIHDLILKKITSGELKYDESKPC